MVASSITIQYIFVTHRTYIREDNIWIINTKKHETKWNNTFFFNRFSCGKLHGGGEGDGNQPIPQKQFVLFTQKYQVLLSMTQPPHNNCVAYLGNPAAQQSTFTTFNNFY